MRVLIVDDLEANRMLLSYLVEKQGNVAITCSNAEDALDAYQTHGADLIFMDVVMPGVDGYAAAKQLKDVIGTYFVPIIFITALQDEDALIRCLEFGDDYLIRPFNQIMFNAKIAAHTRTIELHRKAQQQHEELNYLILASFKSKKWRKASLIMQLKLTSKTAIMSKPIFQVLRSLMVTFY